MDGDTPGPQGYDTVITGTTWLRQPHREGAMVLTDNDVENHDDAVDDDVHPAMRQPPHPPSKTQQQQKQQEQHIVLFYKYHPLSADPTVVDVYRTALERLCQSLNLRGRILVGCNEHRSEGINGTLSGGVTELDMFVRAMQGASSPSSGGGTCGTKEEETPRDEDDDGDGRISDTKGNDAILDDFWMACDRFYRLADCPPLTMEPSDFKWSRASSTTAAAESSGTHARAGGSNMVDGHAKSSTSNSNSTSPFPDLNIKIVKELIGTGGTLASIPLDEIHQGYLTPQEWHDRVMTYNTRRKKLVNDDGNDDSNDGNDDGGSTTTTDDTILIDCRNTKECQIGHFIGAIDPQTTTFNQFTQWVHNHKQSLSSKKTILMYCTGGIRCEKASAYIRRVVPSVQEVLHLKGGIHRYLEEFDASGVGDGKDDDGNGNGIGPIWRGKNFVFDGRGAHGPPTSSLPSSSSSSSGVTDRKRDTTVTEGAIGNDNDGNGNNGNNNDDVVGSCRYCCSPYDSFDPHCVCTVCREPTLVCPSCQQINPFHEYHCKTHQHLQGCYFTNLQPYSVQQLQHQLHALQQFIQDIAIGKKYKQRRKTLVKQCEKIMRRLQELEATGMDSGLETNNGPDTLEWKCRNCGQVGCSGKCWGFHGLKRKRILESQQQQQHQQWKQSHTGTSDLGVAINTHKAHNQHNSERKENKELQKEEKIQEWIRLGLTQPPSVGRNPSTGLRVPAPCTRILETKTKGKWCGLSLLGVLETEFADLTKTVQTLPTLLRRGLIRVNGKPIRSLEDAESLRLKNMDVISRIVHWHEPPIHLPEDRIRVQKVTIPKEAFARNAEGNGNTSDDIIARVLYVCNKPSTVPVHPAGPYLSNTLTLLVEAQEGLTPKTLIPCHRIDRVTSGMTLCCTDIPTARLVQTAIDQGRVRKQYVAKVHGRFPSDPKDANATARLPSHTDIAKWRWLTTASDNDDAEDDGDDDLIDRASMLQVDAPVETVDPANGIRKITPDGKPSTSRFVLMEYDETSNTSTIRCFPVTGRSHQLRVHLQWLGHPIVQDIQYGGTFCDNSSADVSVTAASYDLTAGTQCMQDAIEAAPADAANRTLPIQESVGPCTFSLADTNAAREVCPTCQGGPASAFTAAQLLQGGHAICLHAHRYSLFFSHRHDKNDGTCLKKSTTTDGDKHGRHCSDEDFVRVDLRVDLPPWALSPARLPQVL